MLQPPPVPFHWLLVIHTCRPAAIPSCSQLASPVPVSRPGTASCGVRTVRAATSGGRGRWPGRARLPVSPMSWAFAGAAVASAPSAARTIKKRRIDHSIFIAGSEAQSRAPYSATSVATSDRPRGSRAYSGGVNRATGGSKGRETEEVGGTARGMVRWERSGSRRPTLLHQDHRAMLSTDVLVIGSEGAGARAAWEVADRGLRVTVVTKGRLARSGATLTGAADMDVDSRSLQRLLGPEPGTSGVAPNPADSPEVFFRDMLVEGKWINDQRQVLAHVEDVPERAREVLEAGLKVYDLRQMPGHSYPRNMYTSGHDLIQVLKREIKRRPVRMIEDVMITDLLTRDGQVMGAVGLDLERGEPVAFAAKAVVMATGGAHNVFEYNTGPEELTGDGQAMALRAGAELLNMEMMQFLPTTIVTPPLARGNLFPFLLGPQNALRVWLLNKYGERFMARWDPERMECSTRDLL